jgi:uncharacterized protein YndB with AHSA1/START domain
MNTLEKFTLEFQIEISSKLLYTLISTPEGLARWFAESVTAEENVFCFKWGESQQMARLVQSKQNSFVHFQWLDDFHQDMILELQILHEPVSTGVSLLVTDYAEADDLDFTLRLWQTQVGHLRRIFNS